MKKPTLATFKSFVKKNTVFIKRKSSFDGMTDCVQSIDGEFAQVVEKDLNEPHTLGITGLWLVGSSRDMIRPYFDGKFTGYEVYNCCGSSIIATPC